MSEEHFVTEEHLTESEMVARAAAILATVAEERGDDLDELLVTLPWPDMMTVMYAVGNVAVEALALLHGLDNETPEGRQAVAEQARRMAVRELSDDDG
ncbi:hypothetical protein ACPCUF_02305 [Streptomyces griseoincarnatus]